MTRRPLARDWRPHHGALSRRSLLRGMVGGLAATLALPPLEAMFDANGTAYAFDGILPTRFGLWFWGNGNLPRRWVPDQTGVGDAWNLSPQLAPLAPVKSKIAVLTGYDCKVANTSPHGSGRVSVLSGADFDESTGRSVWAQPTIDQVIAQAIGNDTLYRSVQTAASNTAGESWNGPDSRNPAEPDPYALYDRLFGDTFVEPGGDGTVDPRLGLRRSVLDRVLGDVTQLQSRLGEADKRRLDQHLSAVREMELRLARLQEDPPDLEACVRPSRPTLDIADVGGRARVRERNQIMSELLAMALACDQTRVFGHYVVEPVNDILFPGASDGHHGLTHNEGGEQPTVDAITIQIMEMLSDTLQILDGIPEGDGTLLDHMVLFATSEVSLAQTHSILDMPVILGGSACGYFQQDVHVRSLSGDNVTKVLIGLQRAMGMQVSRFGVGEAEATDEVTEVRA
jgi:hypothetical protein